MTPVCSDSPRQPYFMQLFTQDLEATAVELKAALSASSVRLSPKFLYDALGSTLFDAITRLPEYYPTRTEALIVDTHLDDIARAVGPVGTLIDLGAGNCEKAARLLPALQPDRYVAVDISADFLAEALARLQRLQPSLETWGLGLDFSGALTLPDGAVQGRPLFFYPGSSIGNFDPAQALSFLTGLRKQVADGALLIGVDLLKPVTLLEPAYDDALGVTAAFNLNLLLHLNRLLGSNFDPRGWRHAAHFNAADSRIEMHLEARSEVTVQWPGGTRRFLAGERIHTENSHKHSVRGFAALLADAGFRTQRHWCDPQGWFAVFLASA